MNSVERLRKIVNKYHPQIRTGNLAQGLGGQFGQLLSFNPPVVEAYDFFAVGEVICELLERVKLLEAKSKSPMRVMVVDSGRALKCPSCARLEVEFQRQEGLVLEHAEKSELERLQSRIAQLENEKELAEWGGSIHVPEGTDLGELASILGDGKLPVHAVRKGLSVIAERDQLRAKIDAAVKKLRSQVEVNPTCYVQQALTILTAQPERGE